MSDHVQALNDLKTEVKGLKDLAQKAAGAAESQAELKTRLDALDAAQQKWMKTRSLAGQPEMDPRLLNFSPSQKSWDQLMQSKPVASDKSGLNPLVEACQHAADKLIIYGALMGWVKDSNEAQGAMVMSLTPELKASTFWKEYSQLKAAILKATLDSATTGEGLEFVPTGISQQIRQKLELSLKVAGLFETFNMPQNPFDWPYGLAGTAQYVAQGTTAGNVYNLADADMIYGAAAMGNEVTFSCRKARAMQLITRELTEDGIMATMPWLINRIIRSLGDAREDAILNGDTAGTHMDNDVTGSNVKKWFNGLRKYGVSTIANTLDISGTIASSELVTLMAKLGVYAAEPENCVWLVSPQVWAKQLLGLTEVKTVDQYGPAATILTGEVSKLFGVPVVISQHMRNDVAATGVNTAGGPNTLSTIILAHRTNWVLGQRPGMGVEQQRMLPTDQQLLCAFDRADFKFIGAQTETSVAVGINVTP